MSILSVKPGPIHANDIAFVLWGNVENISLFTKRKLIYSDSRTE